MKKITCLLPFIVVFLACNKLHDLIPSLPILPQPQFNKIYGEQVHDQITALTRRTDEGYLLTGYTYFGKDEDDTSTVSNYKSWIMKLDKNGNKLWQKTLDDTGAGTPYAIAKSRDGGFLLSGITVSTNVSGSHGPQGDAWVVKTDSDGKLLWQKAFGGTHLDMAYAVSSTADGGYIMAGLTESSDGDVSDYHGGTSDGWIVKVDKNGNKQWQKTLGGSYDNAAKVIITRLDGSYVMAGISQSDDGDVGDNHGGIDVWIRTIQDR